MSRWFRAREDAWLSLLLGLLLLVAARFLFDGQWLYAALTGAFMIPPSIIWYRQGSARWCSHCNRPMEMERVVSGQYANQRYRCSACGRSNKTGVQLEWPE